MTQTPYEIDTASTTNVGRVRKQNQDSFGEFHAEDGTRLLIVADGMGGHRGGEVASATAIQSVGKTFEAGVGDPEDFLARAFAAANNDILKLASKNSALTNMGTTGVALLILPNQRAFVANIGDSRAYRLRDGDLTPITDDHSWVADQVRAGRLDEAEAEEHPRRNVLSRCIGIQLGIEADIDEVELHPGDQFLLCSDGLWGAVPAADIVEVLENEAPDSAVELLIGLANERGGPDNITAQVARVGNGESTDGKAAGEASGLANSSGVRLAVGVAVIFALLALAYVFFSSAARANDELQLDSGSHALASASAQDELDR